jgi:protein-disulfide isomerase
MHQLGEVQGKYQVSLDLESHAKAEALRSYLNSLEKESRFEVYLDPPKQILVRHAPGELLKSGDRKEVVIYQDYECPFCRALEPEISRLIQSDSSFTSVKITIKQLPLSIHKRSFEAAVAAVCSADQGLFREMHARLVEDQDHSDHGLEQSAAAVGLDINRFDQCMHSDKAAQAVLRDMDDARLEGVEATPTVFIDSNRVSLPQDPKDLQVFLDARLKENSSLTSEAAQASRQIGGQQ